MASNGIILLDLRKAFDLVNHKLLHDKLRLYKCDSICLLWLELYLSDRQQRVYFHVETNI